MDSGFKGRDLALLGLLALLLFAAGVRWRAIGPDARTQDELIYTRWGAMMACEKSGLPYAQAVGRQSRDIPYAYLFLEYNSFPMAWNGPSPLRAGYIGLLSGFMRASGPQNINVGVWVSTTASLLTLGILAVMAWRLLGPGPALLFAGLMAVSPLDLLLARRCWMDSVLANAALLMLLAGLWAATGRSPWRFAALFASALWLLLLKEAAFVIVGILGLWAAALSRQRTRAWNVPLSCALALLAAGVAAAAVLIHLAGGWPPARDAFGHCLGAVQQSAASPKGWPSVALFEGIPMIDDPLGAATLPWYGPVLGLWALSPLTLVLGAWGLAAALRRWKEEGLLGGWAWCCLLYFAVVCLQPKSLRWLAPIDPGLHLLAAWAGWSLSRRIGPWVLAVLALLAAGDYVNARGMMGVVKVGEVEQANVADPTLPAVRARSPWLPK